MRIFLLILIIIFSFQSSTKDDITDFEIEGMSIGDSLLNFALKNQIQYQVISIQIINILFTWLINL